MLPRNYNSRSVDDLDRALGDAIRARRNSLQISQDELATACGISFQQVQKYERGENRISFSRLAQIARALSCSIADLIAIVAHPEIEASDFTALELIMVPGAADLLSYYADLSPRSRRLFLDFVDTWPEPERQRLGRRARRRKGD